MKKGILISAIVAFLLSFGAVLMAQEQEMRIELLGSLGTRASHKGDKVFGRVQAPDAYKGDTVEGKVRESHSGSKLRGGGAVLNFTFETLQHGGQAIPISTVIKSFQNSRGDADVDEEGRIVRKGGGNEGKAIGGTFAGGLIGGLAGGWRGAAIGSATGAAASIAVIEITADSPDIRFEPGSVVTVNAQFTNGAPSGANAAPEASAASQPAKSPALAERRTSPAAAAATPEAGGPAAAQPNFTAVKNDFIPGEKTVFFDDFTDVEPGDALPHWKVRSGAVEVREAGAIRLASPTGGGGSAGPVMTPLLKGIPNNFTIETEVLFDNPQDARMYWYFHPKGGSQDGTSDVALQFELYAYENGTLTIDVLQGSETLAKVGDFPCDFSKPVQIGIWVQNGRVRYYVNGKRAVDVNQVELPPLQTAQLETVKGDHGPTSYRFFRIAESLPDFSHSIFSNGRYVTYGILFDVDSDRIKPESATVIQSIAKGLQANSSLKLSIEGHTDNTGKADHNMILSKQRAEAVKNVLVSQFQIDASRLSTVGMGSTKPLASNDDSQGRSQNRRVEFVKQ